MGMILWGASPLYIVWRIVMIDNVKELAHSKGGRATNRLKEARVQTHEPMNRNPGSWGKVRGQCDREVLMSLGNSQTSTGELGARRVTKSPPIDFASVEHIISNTSITEAWEKVRSNKGATGVETRVRSKYSLILALIVI
jgi:hypothetical protein